MAKCENQGYISICQLFLTTPLDVRVYSLSMLVSLTLACSAAAMQHATNGTPPCFRALG